VSNHSLVVQIEMLCNSELMVQIKQKTVTRVQTPLPGILWGVIYDDDDYQDDDVSYILTFSKVSSLTNWLYETLRNTLQHVSIELTFENLLPCVRVAACVAACVAVDRQVTI